MPGKAQATPDKPDYEIYGGPLDGGVPWPKHCRERMVLKNFAWIRLGDEIHKYRVNNSRKRFTYMGLADRMGR